MAAIDRLKNFLQQQVDWRQFVLGTVCLFFGTLNIIYYRTWFNDAASVVALVMAGFSFSGSLLAPILKSYGRKFDEMTERFKAIDPTTAAKAATKAFRAEILEMQARGEFGPDVQIVIGDGPPPELKPPGRRLN
jgi:glucan phosphoethanolaminetransferase (alkaline phosphatase superfamily)